MFVAAAPGFETLGDAVVRGLAELGAGAALDATGADDPVLAAEANRYAADLFLAFRARRRSRAAVAATSSRAASGPRRATRWPRRSARSWRRSSEATRGIAGRAYAVLRETRMAAVICEPVAQADVDAMRAWSSAAPTSPRRWSAASAAASSSPPTENDAAD